MLPIVQSGRPGVEGEDPGEASKEEDADGEEDEAPGCDAGYDVAKIGPGEAGARESVL